jgi:hypothetical protein
VHGPSPEEHAGIDGDLVPQAIGIAADIARFHLPGSSKLFLDGDVPLLDAR